MINNLENIREKTGSAGTRAEKYETKCGSKGKPPYSVGFYQPFIVYNKSLRRFESIGLFWKSYSTSATS